MTSLLNPDESADRVRRFALLVGAIWLLTLGSPASAQDLTAAVDAFWAAGSAGETDRAVQAILALEPDVEPLWSSLRAGAVYSDNVPRGRLVMTRENADGVDHRYVLHVPEDYDPARRYPARGVQRMAGGWGILLDDLYAGAYALIVTQAAARWLLPIWLAG